MTRLTEALLGFETDREPIDSPITVGTSSSRLIDANPNRLSLTMINPSTNDVWIDTTANVSVGEGFIVSSNKGVVTFAVESDGDLVGEEFHAIADGGTADLAVKSEQAVGSVEVS